MERNFTIASLENCLSQLKRADESVVRKAIESGDGLNESTNDVGQKLSEAHRSAVNDCLENSEKLAELHKQINACDKVFERLQNVLYSFQDNLGTIGEDMKLLQVQSFDIHQELENRMKVRAELSQFVDDIVVPQHMIRTIMDTEPNHRGFIEALHELHHKISLIASRQTGEAIAVHDTIPVLESLKIKAIEKVREWLLTKIYQFRKPLTNYQVFQHQLLKCRFFYEFVHSHDPIIAKEIQEEYIDTISKMFFTYFKAYSSRLFKLTMKDEATKDDLLGAVDSVKSSSLAGFFSAKPQVRNKATVFSLGHRHSILEIDFLSALIVPHAASQHSQSYQFEALFRSIQLAFVDHYSHEYLFINDFFMSTEHDTIELHSRAMSRAVSVLLKCCEEQIVLNWDAISLHLCLALCEKFRKLLIEREVPPVSGYWETLSNILWVRLDLVMSAHNESVKSLDLKKLQSNGALDARPHYVVRRYAELTSAHLSIARCNGREICPKMEALLESSEDTIEQLLTRMSCMQTTHKNKHVFLINNYDLILGIIDDNEAKHSRVYAIIHELEQKSIDDFVESVLDPHIGFLIKFVTECESLINQGHTQLLVRHNDKISNAVSTINLRWKSAIDAINAEIVQLFTNFSLGTSILQSTFSKFIQYIQRFTKILAHEAFAGNSAANELINVHQIMLEIKKFKPVY
ncbi:unnamed protein product [Caenorhabditis bovis]|uniref:Vacuolar protein sorting-associated protein 52 homolog n=1 Tax=Caenorhabditis bovis TaxID=2654633 RepID=A0A8S1E654_9PELO|nr:unnamed protein product [Caenorhabditis bovis]